MTGQVFQDKLDAIVADLQTNVKGRQIYISMPGADNNVTDFRLSSDSNGVVDATQLSEIQSFLDTLKSVADDYMVARAPVMMALDAFNVRRTPHQALIDAASSARTALNTALDADATYQQLKTALATARAASGYIAAVTDYQFKNVSENFGNLGDAKGKYVV